MLLAGIGVWGLVGCFYLPLPEHAASGEKDLQTIFGQSGSHRLLSVGSATRGSVVALLGTPPYVVDDGRSIAYVFKTEGSLWVLPLCFQAEPATEGYYAVRLTFDDRDILAGWKFALTPTRTVFIPFIPASLPKKLLTG